MRCSVASSYEGEHQSVIEYMQDLTGQQIDSDVIEIILSESNWQGNSSQHSAECDDVTGKLVIRLSVNRLPVKLPITGCIFKLLIIDLPTSLFT